MNDSRTVSDLAKSKLDALKAKGVELTYDDIVRINAICNDIMSPQARKELSRGKPIACGNDWLWPMTLRAWHWYQSVGCEIGDGERALAFAMAHSYSDCVLTATEKTVNAWAVSLNVTAAEMRVCMALVIAQYDRDEIPKEVDKRQSSIGEIVATMQAIHGGTAQQWEAEVSSGYVFDVLDIMAAQSREKGGYVDAMKERAWLALLQATSEIEARLMA